MSSKVNREVDERVVQMTFNNAEFEKGVSQSLSTLEKLKRALDFKHRPTGLEDFGRAIGSVERNLAPIAKDVDHIADRFTALGIIGDQVIRNLTNKVVNFGERVVKSATLEPLTSGFKEYETQMKSVQTILANTGMEGQKGVARVNAALDELNEYADKTIYNFTEMTNNIGRFTAAGVKLQPAVDAIKGTANLAAMSGSTSEQASRAMYNLSQALSTGTLKLMDWNSVVNAGMGGQVFQNALIQAAAAMDGMGDKVDEWKAKHVDAFGSFRDSLQKGWITSDVLSEALKNFTYDVKEGTKEYEEALKELVGKGYTEQAAKDILKMARQATEAATKVRTFTQLIDTLKEALGSGWSQSWRIIFGDFYEATELWTGISDALGGLIDSISTARNNALQAWKGFDVGGRLDLLEAMKELVYDIALIIKPISDAFHDVFGEFNAEGLRSATLAFKDFVSKLHPSVEGFNSIKKIATTVFSIIKNGTTIAVRGINAVLTVGQPLLYLADSLLVAFSDLLDAVANNTLILRMATILTTVGKYISAVLMVAIVGLIKGIYAVGGALRSIRIDGFVNTIAGAVKSFVDWVKALKPVRSAMNFFNTITNGARNVVTGLVNAIANGINYLKNLGNYISNLPMVQNTIAGIKVVLSALWGVLVGIGDIIKNIFTSIGSINLMEIANPLELIKQIVLSVVNSVVNGINKAGNAIAARFPMFNTLRSMVESVVNAFKAGVVKLKEFFTSLKDNNVSFDGGAAGLRSIVDSIKEFIAIIDPAKAAALAITMVMLGMALTFIRVGNVAAKAIGSFNTVLTTVTKAINGFVNTQSNKIIQAAEAVLMVAAALAILAGIPRDDLILATKCIVAIVAAIGILQVALEKVRKIPKVESGDVTKNIVELGGMALRILEMTAAFAIMIDTLNKIKGLDFKGLEANLLTVLGAFALVVITAVALDKLKISFSKGTVGILVLSAAIWSLCSALKQLEGLKAYNIHAALKGLIPMMGMLTAISFAAKGIGITTGLGLILTASAIEKILPQIERIYNAFKKAVDFDAVLKLVEKHKEGFALISAALFGLAAIAGIFGKGLKDFGTAILAMSASFIVMTFALEKLAKVAKADNIGTAMLIMAGMFLMITTWLALAAFIPEKSAILKVGVAIGLMSASLLIMNVALSQLADMKWDEAGTWIAAGVLAGLTLLLTNMMWIAGKAGEAKGTFGIMASMMAGLSVVIAELIGLSLIRPQELIMPLISVGTILVLMANMMKSVTGVTHYNTQGVIAMVGVIFSMVVMLQALSDLSKLDPKGVFVASVSIGVVLLSMSNMLKQISNFSGTFDASKGLGMFMVLAGVIGALAVVMYSLQQLASYDFNSLAMAGLALSGVIAIVGALTVYISKNAVEWKNAAGSVALLVSVIIALGAVTGALWLLKDIDGDQLLKSSIAVTGALIGIGLLVALFQKFDAAAIKGAAIGALAIGAFISIVMLELIGIQQLIRLSTAEDGSNAWTLIKEFAQNAGDAIGTFIASLSNAAFSKAESIGQNLTKFAEAAEKFFTITGGLTLDSVKGVFYLALALGAITASSFLDTITNFLNFGKSSLQQFADSMPILAKALIGYNDVINATTEGTDEKPDFSRIESSATALSSLCKALSEIPTREEGLLPLIFGKVKLDQFGAGLTTIAIGLVAYTNIVSKISDWGVVEPSMTALSKLANIAKQIPTTDGALNWIFGNNDLGLFATNLITLGYGIQTYASLMRKCTQQDFDSMTNSMTALKSVVDVAKTIPNSGGILANVFTGDNDIGDFGTKLATFGTNFATFSHDIATTDTHAVNRNAKALSGFVAALLDTEKLNLYTFDEIIPHIKQAIESMLQGIISSVGDHLDLVTTAVKNLADAIVEEAKHHNKDMRGVGRDYADRIGKGVSSQGAIDQLATDMETLVSNAIEKAKEKLNTTANESGAEIGQEFVNGVIGPDGIDPDVNPGPNEPSDKLLNTITSLVTNTFEQVKTSVGPLAEQTGAFLGDKIGNFDYKAVGDNVINGISNYVDTVKKLANGEIQFTDLLKEGIAGSDVWANLGNSPIFKLFDKVGEGTDIEREIERALGGSGLTGASDSATKALKGTSSALSKAKNNLQTYTKYLKYSAKVEEAFAKTTGAAMSSFNNEAPITNARKAIAALAEQIYADSQKVQEAIEDTEQTATDKSIAIMKAFNDDYEAIKNSVGDSVDIFKNFYSEAFNTAKGSTIIENITSQLEGYNSMATKFEILASRGIPMDYIQELSEKGAEGFGELQSVLAFTNDETTRFIEAWTKYRDLGDEIATNVMTAKATSLTVEQLKQQAVGAKKYNKEVRDLYLTYKRLFKEIQNKGNDPFGNEEFVETFNKLNETALKTGTSLKALDESLAEGSAESAQAALDMIYKYTEAEAVLDKYNTTFNSTREGVKSLIESQLNTFETFTKKTSISADDMIDILTSQTKGIAQWSKELSTLASRGLSQDILDDLARLGPEGYEKVHAFYKMSDSQLAEANTLYSQKLAITDRASRTIGTSFANAAVGGVEAYKQALTDAVENKEQFESIIEQFTTTITDDINGQTSAQIIAGGKDIGKELTQSIADSAKETKSVATDAAKEVAKDASKEAADTVTEEGEKTVTPAAVEAIENTSEKAVDALHNQTDEVVIPAIKAEGKKIQDEMAKAYDIEIYKTPKVVSTQTTKKTLKNDDYIPLEKKKVDSTTYKDKVKNKVTKTTGVISNKVTNSERKLDVKTSEKYYNDDYLPLEKKTTTNTKSLTKTIVDSTVDGLTSDRAKKVYAKAAGDSVVGLFTGKRVDLERETDNTFELKENSKLWELYQRYGSFTDKDFNKFFKNDPTVGNNINRVLQRIYELTVAGYKDYNPVYNKDDIFWSQMLGVIQTDSLDQYLKTLNEMGRNYDLSISDGILNSNEAEKAAYIEADNIIKITRDELKMHSPSRVGIDIGEMYGLGIALGILNSISTVSAAISQLLNSIISSTEESMSSPMTVTQMIQNALINANTTDDTYGLTRPVITPVIDYSSAQNGFNVLGNMFGNPTMDLGLYPNLPNQYTVPNAASSMVTAIKDNKYDDSRLLNEINGLREDINAVNEKVGNMQVVMDSGQLVGSIAPKMDTELGTIYRRRNRG